MTVLNDPAPPAAKRPKAALPRIGEELPVFCEKCGYSLHGLEAVRCAQCEILHFACPECGHHQPINTLRPAVQRVLGRLRAAALIGIVFFKLNYFGWLLIAWFGMGVEWIYSGSSTSRFQYHVHGFDIEICIAFLALGAAYAMVGRMLLLRWRSGLRVGLVLAALAWAAVAFGAWLSHTVDHPSRTAEPLWTSADFLYLAAFTCITIVLCAVIVWPIWAAMVRVLIPRNAGRTLLEWQRSGSDRSASDLARG